MNHRPERVGKLISNELSKLIKREVEFQGALVTITNVNIDKKMDHASVGISIIPKEKEVEVLETLSKAASQLQYKLHHHLNIKPMPKLVFKIDSGSEEAARIEKILIDEESSGNI
ncbi:MAG: ribosome-binding factor A [Anaplasmataceae bacterium]|nr:ribosome-binding factor A [Anaplasmataceae bacterium]